MLTNSIDNDLKTSLKEGDAIKVSTLRMLKAAIKNVAIEKHVQTLDDNDIIQIIAKQIKQHNESIDGFKKGNRSDLVDKETKELQILQSYMPKQLSEEEVINIIQLIVKEGGASGKKDLGMVMKAAMDKVRGRFDGKLLNQLVLKELDK